MSLAIKMVLVLNFNSIKVRLKHLVDQIKIGVESLFQFHKGTIKTFFC